jgi:hypothetical protein
MRPFRQDALSDNRVLSYFLLDEWAREGVFGGGVWRFEFDWRRRSPTFLLGHALATLFFSSPPSNPFAKVLQK